MFVNIQDHIELNILNVSVTVYKIRHMHTSDPLWVVASKCCSGRRSGQKLVPIVSEDQFITICTIGTRQIHEQQTHL